MVERFSFFSGSRSFGFIGASERLRIIVTEFQTPFTTKFGIWTLYWITWWAIFTKTGDFTRHYMSMFCAPKVVKRVAVFDHWGFAKLRQTLISKSFGKFSLAKIVNKNFVQTLSRVEKKLLHSHNYTAWIVILQTFH